MDRTGVSRWAGLRIALVFQIFIFNSKTAKLPRKRRELGYVWMNKIVE